MCVHNYTCRSSSLRNLKNLNYDLNVRKKYYIIYIYIFIYIIRMIKRKYVSPQNAGKMNPQTG